MTLLGMIAGVLTTACWIPQILRTLRTRSAKDFSWTYLIVITTGVALWFLYGLGRRDAAVATPNGVTLLFLLVLVTVKAQSRRSGRGEAVPASDDVPASVGS